MFDLRRRRLGADPKGLARDVCDVVARRRASLAPSFDLALRDLRRTTVVAVVTGIYWPPLESWRQA